MNAELSYFKRFGFKTSLLLSILFNFVISIEYAVYLLTLKHIQEDLHFNDRSYGFLIAMMAICSICYNPIYMHICTIYPPYFIMAISVSFAIIGDIIIMCAQSYGILIIALAVKGMIGPATNCLDIIFDASANPKNRIMWVNKLRIAGAIGGVLGVVIAVLLPWRQVYLVVALLIAPVGVVFAVIDGPSCLPRNDNASPLSQGILQIYKRLVCTPRVWVMLIIVNCSHVVVSTQVEFYAKFIEEMYNWPETKSVYLGGAFWLVGTVSGKYVGAYFLDRKKNQMGLIDETLTPNLRENLYTSIIRFGLPWFLILQIVGTFGFYIHYDIAFLCVILVQCFALAYFPETSIQLWSVPLDDVPYVYPLGSIVWSGSHALIAMIMGSLLDAGVSYPSTFMIVTTFGWLSVFMICVESFTNWVGNSNQDANDDRLLMGDDHIKLDAFEQISQLDDNINTTGDIDSAT